jgi:hypothetical protein
LKDTFYNIEKEARRRGLLVHENKPKYMQTATAVHSDEHLCCGQRNFQYVEEISYLGSQMNQTNSISSEIEARVLSGNRCYYIWEINEIKSIKKKLKVKNIQEFNMTCSDIRM